ncbi:MAG: trypsin-like peptidase domain-containing protein [Eubacteriales bacterium]|nr:trypsin-like peptidase domain-containing protein [Eubacteriales bacterium]
MEEENKLGFPSEGTGNQEEGTRKDPDRVMPKYGYYHTQNHVETQTQNSGRNQNRDKKKPSFGKRILQTVAIAVIFGMVSSLVFTGMNSLIGGGKNSSDADEQLQIAGADEAEAKSVELIPDDAAVTSDAAGTSDTLAETSDKGAVAAVAEAAMPAVVAITTVSVQEIRDWFGGTHQYASEGSGSGIIVGENDTELLIATNNHVVSGATNLNVFFYGSTVSAESGNDSSIDTDEAVAGSIKGTDANVDLAVVAVKKDAISSEVMAKIKIAKLGDSENLVVGEQVVAIGNALGYGQSVTSGWVSALNRSLTMSDGVASDLIQTDAAINPGNSGGALLNMKGELIGINSAKYADQAVEGMGYAIPLSKALPILQELMNRETREVVDPDKAAYLGVSFTDISSESKKMYNLPSGAFIQDTLPGTAAEAGGIQKGDIIVKLADYTISSADDLINALQYFAAGEEISISYMRSSDGTYQEYTTQVTLGSQP